MPDQGFPLQGRVVCASQCLFHHASGPYLALRAFQVCPDGNLAAYHSDPEISALLGVYGKDPVSIPDLIHSGHLATSSIPWGR